MTDDPRALMQRLAELDPELRYFEGEGSFAAWLGHHQESPMLALDRKGQLYDLRGYVVCTLNAMREAKWESEPFSYPNIDSNVAEPPSFNTRLTTLRWSGPIELATLKLNVAWLEGK